jgi:hypothetical protein
MKRDAGLAATLTAVLMLFGFSTFQRQGTESPPARQSSEQVAALPGAEPKQESPYAPCAEIAKPLRRFSETPQPWALPGFCYQSGKAPKRSHTPQFPLRASGQCGVQFAIALVPNPISTHLPLMFDGMIESIQQAAQDDGYSYDSSWFPWQGKSESYTHLIDDLAAERLRDIRQDQPGVIVFRGGGANPYESGLVVFLVGEQPTGGLSDGQFENALQWIALLSEGNKDPKTLKTLDILGPTSSGTLPSLQRELARNLCSTEIHVSSGDASEGGSIQRFQDWIEPQQKDKPKPCPEQEQTGSHPCKDQTNPAPHSYFRTARESDSLTIERFCRYLRSQGYNVQRVAEISEDETAFGAGPQPNSHCVASGKSNGSSLWPGLSLRYPRDIATLRTAYQQQSVFSSSSSGASTGTGSNRLRGDLTEPAGGDRDTLQHYAGSLSSSLQESILVDITNRLADNRIQFIILRSTNSLDQIFLAEFLRRTYPQGRIVIDGADLLFTQGSWAGPLRGVMVLSTYPLLTEEQIWTPSLLPRADSALPQNRVYRSFGEDASEGEYIAARELFSGAGQDPRDAVPIHDYAPPAWATDYRNTNDPDNYRPTTWLTVIGHRRFWPVAVLNGYTFGSADRLPSVLLSYANRGDKLALSNVDPPPIEFPLPMMAFLIACLACAAYHFYLCRSASITGSPRARAYFAPIPAWQHPALIALGGLLLAMLAVTVATSSGWLTWRLPPGTFHQPRTGVLLTFWSLAVLGCGLLGITSNYRLKPLVGDKPEPRSRRWKACAAAGASGCLLAFIMFKVYLVLNLRPANAFPAFWRALNLTSGVSTLLPQMLLLAGMYAWFWCTLRGFAHFGEDRPVLPGEAALPPLSVTPGETRTVMPTISWEHAGAQVETAARPWSRSYLRLLAVLFVLSAAVGAIALGSVLVPLRTLGELAYGRFIFLWVCLCVAIVLADVIQLARVWVRLRELLVHLERLPLQRTLRALRGLEWGSLWKMSGNVLEERYRMITLQIQSLRHLYNLMTGDEKAMHLNPDISCKLTKCFERELRDLTNWYAGLKCNGTVQGRKPLPAVRRASAETPAFRVAAEEPQLDGGRKDVKCEPGVKPLHDFQQKLSEVAGAVMTEILLPAWRQETHSLLWERSAVDKRSDEDEVTSPAHVGGDITALVQAAEEFLVLHYLAFIQNIFGRLRTMVLGMLWLFVGTTLAIASYPFEPVDVLGGIFLAVFVLAGCVLVVAYAQMCRDVTLSYITNTKPGQLGWEFWFRLATFGIGPLAGLMTALFPSISDFIFSWLQPSVQAFH